MIAALFRAYIAHLERLGRAIRTYRTSTADQRTWLLVRLVIIVASTDIVVAAARAAVW